MVHRVDHLSRPNKPTFRFFYEAVRVPVWLLLPERQKWCTALIISREWSSGVVPQVRSKPHSNPIFAFNLQCSSDVVPQIRFKAQSSNPISLQCCLAGCGFVNSVFEARAQCACHLNDFVILLDTPKTYARGAAKMSHTRFSVQTPPPLVTY